MSSTHYQCDINEMDDAALGGARPSSCGEFQRQEASEFMQVRLGLANAVEVVRKRIQQVRDRKEIIGEQNTKAALIDPILIALGWDLHENDEIRREYRRKPQDNPVDYSLFLNRTESLCRRPKSSRLLW